MSALFNFHSFLTVVLLGICTCTYVKMHFPAILEQRTGFRGFFWKAARIGVGAVFFPWVYVALKIGCHRQSFEGRNSERHCSQPFLRTSL
ncbi:hypothetical protein K2173_002713 [Erythroxylum novogranatense]|uniref:Protein kish n=1 Tax=Erythroxylum novogranatense TaxID=1862640 RepID=A0AAV8SY15_9ROSI|nr:hypothetical protein K2173_002713 [Erythroxylum novogranatense]